MKKRGGIACRLELSEHGSYFSADNHFLTATDSSDPLPTVLQYYVLYTPLHYSLSTERIEIT